MFENAGRKAAVTVALFALPAFAFSTSNYEVAGEYALEQVGLAMGWFCVCVVLAVGGAISAFRVRAFVRAGLLLAMVALHPALWIWALASDGGQQGVETSLFWTLTLGLASLAAHRFPPRRAAWLGGLFVVSVVGSLIGFYLVEGASPTYAAWCVFGACAPITFVPLAAFAWSVGRLALDRFSAITRLVEAGLWLVVAGYALVLAQFIVMSATNLRSPLIFIRKILFGD